MNSRNGTAGPEGMYIFHFSEYLIGMFLKSSE